MAPALLLRGSAPCPIHLTLSAVDQAAISASPYGALYAPPEKIATIMVDNFPALGRLAALRFLEWVQDNPEGVIALPTGKTPEHFIKRVQQFLGSWGRTETGYFGWNGSSVLHLRLGFYIGDIFTPEPTVEKDVLPVLQSVAEGLRRYEENSGRSDICVRGYRNVWYRFHPSEANIFVPVSLHMFAVMGDAFINSFASQAEASFPSPEHDGPFSDVARRVQVDQYQTVKTCLGREWFHEHPSPLIRGTRGLVCLREMQLEEFYQRSRQLRQAAENV